MKFLGEVLPFIFCLSFMALFAGVVVWVVRSGRKAVREKAERAAQLGFTGVPKIDQALVDKINALYTGRGRRLHLRNVFYRRSADYDLYLFDLWDAGGDDSSLLVDSGAAVVSPHLRLPRLMLFSRVEGDGFLTKAANGLIERFIAGQNRVEFLDEPEFNSHFYATGPDAYAATCFITHDRAMRINSLKNVQIQMNGDIFTLSGNVTNTGRLKVDSLQRISQTLRDAEYLAGCFME